VSIQISSSDTSLVQLYNAGIFNIPSGFANICEWEVTTFQGNIIHQDITSGEFSEQAFSLFNHSVPISDSMEVTLFITNMVEGITCSIVDTIYWEETEVLPGSFIGNWAVLGDYGGVENELLTSVEGIQTRKEIEIQPSLVTNQFIIRNMEANHSIAMFDSMGRKVFDKEVYNQEALNVSSFETGMYYIHIYDTNGDIIDVKKLMKL
jgi:hypothetical protein